MANHRGFKAHFKAEDVQVMADRRRAGESFTAIGRSFGVSGSAITKALRRFGHDVEFGRSPVTLTDEQKAEMVSRYVAGDTSPQIARDFGTNYVTVLRAVEAAGHKVRDWYAANRRVEVDEAAFDMLTPDACYWAGFLTADGSISGSGDVRLTLAESDGHHVLAFRRFMKSNHAVSITEQHGFANAQRGVSCTICSTKVAARLHELGLRNRNQTVALPELAQSPHYWRGVIDGDGSVGDKHSPSISLVGGEALLGQFCDFVAMLSPNPTRRLVKDADANVYECNFSGANAVIALQAMYEDAPTALFRKMVKALDTISDYAKRSEQRSQAVVERAARVCLTPGCGRPFWAKGYCSSCRSTINRRSHKTSVDLNATHTSNPAGV